MSGGSHRCTCNEINRREGRDVAQCSQCKVAVEGEPGERVNEMSRSCYSDDYGDDHPGKLELFRANVERSIRSKAGQARLRELREALLALPVKELHVETFAEGTPEQPQVCALGAWALAKSGGDPVKAAAMVPRDADDHETYEALKAYGWPKLVVFDAIFYNDDYRPIYETAEGPRERHEQMYGPLRIGRDETPQERYTRILTWVEEQIRKGVSR